MLASVATLGLTLASSSSLAQLDIEISGVGASRFPIAVPAFSGNSAAPINMASVIASDLMRSGKFRQVGLQEEIPYNQVLSPTVDYLSAGNPNAAVTGSIALKAPGSWTVTAKLFDTLKGQVLDTTSLSCASADLRMAAHKIADRIYEKIIGRPGCFASRIAYVQQRGKLYELVIADSDGEAPRIALRSREPIISPAWSPNGAQVAYVSFESRKPVVYIHELASGRRRPIAQFRGNNSAPAFSPDGRTLALALSRNGGTQIYLMSASGGAPRQATSGYGINTEPVFSPDGSWIYFTSDRGGAPQIYRQKVAGGAASRVTFNTSYAVSPALSPDGKKLAYVSRSASGFAINVQELDTGNVFMVSKAGNNESPSFSPNGELVLYAASRGALECASAEAKSLTRLSSRGGTIREPAWGPLIK